MEILVDDIILRILVDLAVPEIYNLLRTNKRLWTFWDNQNWWRLRFIQDYGDITYDGNYRQLYRHYGVYIYEPKSKWWLKIPNMRPKYLQTYQNWSNSRYVYIIDRDDNLHLVFYNWHHLTISTVPNIKVQFFRRWSDHQLWVIDILGRLFDVGYVLDLDNNQFMFRIRRIETRLFCRAIYINLYESFIVDNDGGLHTTVDMVRKMRRGHVLDTIPISLRVRCADNSLGSQTAIIDEQGKLYRVGDTRHISIQQIDNFTAKHLACTRDKILAIDVNSIPYLIQDDSTEKILPQPCSTVAINNSVMAIIDQQQILHIKMEDAIEVVDNFKVYQVALGECGMAFVGYYNFNKG